MSQKSPFMIALIAAFIGSLLGSLMTFLLTENTPPISSAQNPEPEILQNDKDYSTIQSTLESLKITDEQIRDRLTRIEEQLLTEMRVPDKGFASAKELDVLRDELNTLAAKPSGTDTAPLLEQQVAEALEEIRDTEAYEEAVAKHEERAASVDQRVTGWSNWLKLDQTQQNQLRDIILVQGIREGDLLQAWGNGTDEEILDQMRRSNWEDHLRSVRGILTYEQAEAMSSKFGED